MSLTQYESWTEENDREPNHQIIRTLQAKKKKKHRWFGNNMPAVSMERRVKAHYDVMEQLTGCGDQLNVRL